MPRRLIALLALLSLASSSARAQGPPDAARSRAAAEYRAAQAALQAENLGEAEQRLRAAVRLDPTFLIAHYSLGQLYMRARRYQDAVAAFGAARRRGCGPPRLAPSRRAWPSTTRPWPA